LISLVTSERGEKQEYDATEREKSEDSSITRAREINRNDRGNGRLGRASVPTQLEESAKECDNDSENEKSWCHHVGENADIRILAGREHIDREKKDESKERTGGQEQAHPADPVSKTIPEWDHGPIL
jgi:hypothetical protein